MAARRKTPSEAIGVHAVAVKFAPNASTITSTDCVQRMPVRIRLKDGEDRDHRLRPGMSVEPKVWLDAGP
jgi:multidrug resistance efflux pump